jgi:very-short-patch-repair endonuclease
MLCKCGCGSVPERENDNWGIGHKKEWLKKQEVQLCACGCGENSNPGRKYIAGHQNKGKKFSEEIRMKFSQSHKGNKQSEETKRKRSNSLRGRVPWNKGLTKAIDNRMAKLANSNKGKQNAKGKRSEETKIKMSLAYDRTAETRILNNPNQRTGNYSDREQMVAGNLKENGIEFEHNKRIGRYKVDFCIFGNVVIEVHGSNWYPKKTASRTEYLQLRGFRVFDCVIKDLQEDVEMKMQILLEEIEV